MRLIIKPDPALENVSLPAAPPWKRSLDLILVMVAFPLVLPLMGCIALMIRMVSRGPVLFRQERVGYRGARFLCYKFRTMRLQADSGVHRGHLQALMSSDAPMVKMDLRGDPRIIPGGRLLRASGLDELPQILNVFRGDMSLVGPRPCVFYEYENYLPWQRERFNALPGLTGLWQVSGKNRTTFTEMVALDIGYIRTKTLGLDLKIIAKTLPVMLGQIIEAGRRVRSHSRQASLTSAAPAVSKRAGNLIDQNLRDPSEQGGVTGWKRKLKRRGL